MRNVNNIRPETKKLSKLVDDGPTQPDIDGVYCKKQHTLWDEFISLKNVVDKLSLLDDEISNEYNDGPQESLQKEGIDKDSLESILNYLPSRIKEQTDRIDYIINSIREKLF